MSMFKLAPEGMSLRDVNIWEDLYDAKERGKIVEVRIKRVRRIDGQGETWELAFEDKPGITGLCPMAETGLPERAPMNNFVGQKIFCKIKDIDRENSIVACSRKEVIDISLSKIISQLEINETIGAIVRTVTGSVYVDIGGGVVLRIPREKARLSDGVPLDVQYKDGSRFSVKVIDLKVEEKLIEVEPVDPWEQYDYKRGEVVSGQVVSLRDNLAFICVQPGIIGRAYYKKDDTYKVGDYVEFKVEDYNRHKRRLHMTRWDSRRTMEKRRQRAKSSKTNNGEKITTLGGFNSANSNKSDKNNE